MTACKHKVGDLVELKSVMKKETMFVSFSGGRTSAYMCWWLLENKSDEYDFIFVFANTGLEHEETLRFVDRCDKEFGLNLVWLESVTVFEVNKSSSFSIVDFSTATRGIDLFESMVKKYGIANPDYPHCNRELKLNPIKAYKESIGYKREHLTAIGIRSDEVDRMNYADLKKGALVYPLIRWTPTTKAEIVHWWAEQDFDLNIPEHYGNCVSCWKKSDRKLFTVAKRNPEAFDGFDHLEQEYGFAGSQTYNDNGELNKRVIFRRHRTTKNIIASSKSDFIEFQDFKPELQLRLDIDDLDVEFDCGQSCEAFQ